MKNKGMRLRVLGTRGSMASGLRNREIFGVSTSCYMITAGEETVFLDAGSGLIAAPQEFPNPPHILLSHLHLDHLLGLGMYPRISQKGQETVIHVPVGAGEDPSEALGRLYSPPFWPVELGSCGGNIRFLPLSFPLRFGGLTVEGIPGNHPGGSFVMKLSFQGKSIVYASDYEYEETSFSRLAEFAHNADLLLYDGQYSIEELGQRQGFGHSTAQYGLELMERCGAGHLWIVHHDPFKTDAQLLAQEAAFDGKPVRFARENDEITIR